MTAGVLDALGTVNSVIAPPVVICPILLPTLSVNQRLPSGPATIPAGELPGVGMTNSMTSPAGVMRPILLAVASVNHRLPSGPSAMPVGVAFKVGTANSVIVCAAQGSAAISAAAAAIPIPSERRPVTHQRLPPPIATPLEPGWPLIPDGESNGTIRPSRRGARLVSSPIGLPPAAGRGRGPARHGESPCGRLGKRGAPHVRRQRAARPRDGRGPPAYPRCYRPVRRHR